MLNMALEILPRSYNGCNKYKHKNKLDDLLDHVMFIH